MVLKSSLGVGARLKLAKSPFIDDIDVSGVIEKTWSDPGLCDKHCKNSRPTDTPME